MHPFEEASRKANQPTKTIIEEISAEEFKVLLEELRKQLLDASMYFDIWEQIWPTSHVVDVINRYKGFFLPVKSALFDQFSIKICTVTGNDPRLPSFYRIFKILDTNPNLTPGVDVQSLRKRLKPHKAVLAAIKSYRNTTAAHRDVTTQVVERKPVLFDESKRMLKEFQGIFNMVYKAAENATWSFQTLEHNDASSALNDLNEQR
ncbi:MAG: hypothetical protein Q7R50_01775 [Dehalococcoidales bacterium]|nr:hypothetical protein [Dehalococcoidales bacterium]